MGGAARRRAARAAASWPHLQPQSRGDPRGDHLPLQHPDHLGLRRLGGLQLPAPGPERHAQRRATRRTEPRSSWTAARQRPELGNLFTSFDPNYPQVKVELDREKARKLGVPVNEVFQAMSASLGGSYVNDFNRFGRLFRVYVQAESDYRRKPEDIGKIYVRSETTNAMIPLSTLVTDHLAGRAPSSPPASTCCARSRSGCRPRRGFTSGQALAALEDVFAGDDAEGDGLRLLRRSPTRRRSRRPPVPTFVARDRLRVPAAGRDVRELAAAVGGAAGLAAGRARRLLRRLARGLRQQRLRADRPHHAHRPCRQERDPDRRVRQGQARRGHGGSRRRRSNRRACASGRS